MRIFYTVYNILFSSRFQRFFYHCFVAVLDLPSQLLHPQHLKLLFDFAEDRLDRIQVWRIRQIPQIPDAQTSHEVLALVGGVRREVVHEEAYLGVAILLSEFGEILLELDDVH